MGAAFPWRARRPRRVALSLLLATLALAAASLATGRHDPGWHALLPSLWQAGAQPGDALARLVLVDLRLPRVLGAIGAGACLAAAGWIFQRLSRNALASPDIVGLTTGSATGGLTAILLLGAAPAAVPWGTLAGGVATVALVYAVAARRGLQGQWLILAGIAVAAMLAAANDYLVTRAELDDAVAARMWLHGSLQGITWAQVAVLAGIGGVLLAATALQARGLDVLEMGDDLSAALGLPVRRVRLGLLAVAVALTVLVISMAGPIGFVALVAPQLARRLCLGVSHLPSVVLTGAGLCVASDWAARGALAPFQLPVGLVTSLLGGIYLAWLLAREWRHGG